MARVADYDAFPPLSVSRAERVFVLTGAGISAESGIKTFRDAGGLWEGHRFQDVASPAGWARDPAMVWKFYSQRRAQLLQCVPNPAHVALAQLEARLGDRLYLATQNVDDLHERAGSQRVVHMHGELLRSRCEACDSPPFADERSYETSAAIPRCICGARIRPHICWFGEIPFELDAIFAALAQCDLFITVGSSGAVYPAAGFVRQVRERGGARSVYVGPEIPDNASDFGECRLGSAVQVLPSLFADEVG